MAAGRKVGRKLFYASAAVALSVKAQGFSVSAVAGYSFSMPPPVFGLGDGGVLPTSAANVAQIKREGPRTTAEKPRKKGQRVFKACGTNYKGQDVEDPDLAWCNHDAVARKDANSMEFMRTSTVCKPEEKGEEKEAGMYSRTEASNLFLPLVRSEHDGFETGRVEEAELARREK